MMDNATRQNSEGNVDIILWLAVDWTSMIHFIFIFSDDVHFFPNLNHFESVFHAILIM